MLRELVRRASPAPGRVLLLGPHPDDFVDWLVGRARSVAVALRSFPDARRLGERHAGRAGFAVYCGQFTKLAGMEPFDVVLALDGFERVHSAESAEHPWRDTLAEVAALVAPGGTVVIATRNELGVQTLADARPHARADGDWFPGGFDETRPGGHERLIGALESYGLTAGACYAAFPTAEAPRALFAIDALLHEGRPLPDAVTVPACARDHDGRSVVADPVQLARKAFRRGLAARLAPSWVTVARRVPAAEGGEVPPAQNEQAQAAEGEQVPAAKGEQALAVEGEQVRAVMGEQAYAVEGEQVPAVKGEQLPVAGGGEVAAAGRGELPLGLAEDDVCGPPWTLVQELRRDGRGRWTRHVPGDAAPVALDRVRRDPAMLSGAVPEGRVLAEVLLTACAYDDVQTIRQVLRQLGGWLAARSQDGMLPGELVFATADNVVWDGERLQLLDPSWALAEPVPLEVALTRVMRRFAVALLRSGGHHPWPWSADPERLTATLLSFCGLTLDRDHLERAVALEEEIRATLGAAAPGRQASPESYRRLLAVRDRLSETLADAQARIDRLEVKLTARERELRRAKIKLRNTRRRLRALRRSFGKRVVQGMSRPPGMAARLLKALRG
ncbi:hypothetical protein [Microtetraspora sp. NBRC 13810]|uniref:hypothetical protein n=1 Tax=Microtetraspora sp. NBRC 13810 TaxID=3030990 RepID=UPI002555D46E|nr:hypothetical protein [Microtetraspora sp. NBRC 13810]